MNIKVTYWADDEEGSYEKEATLPAKNVVCSRCQGNGKILNPAIGEHAYSQEEFEEAFSNEEDRNAYLYGGKYDVTCPICSGNKVVKIVDEACCISDEQKKDLAFYLESCKEAAQFNAQWRNEIRIQDAMMGGEY